MSVKCTACFQELAGGPPTDDTSAYLQRVAAAHDKECKAGFAGNMAQLHAQENSVGAGPKGQLSKEEIAQLLEDAAGQVRNPDEPEV